MSDLISRQAAIDALEKIPVREFEKTDGLLDALISIGQVYRMIKQLPPAQPEIIRCKDCKYAHITYGGEVKYCDIWFPDESHYMDTDNYCSWAERRTDEQV